MTQKDAVKAYLEMEGAITSKDAIERLGITRLADVIYQMKREGVEIETTTKTVQTRYGKTNVAVYRIQRQS